MEFYEVVRQAAALLQQQGRLTYRTLRRQFALDDETIIIGGCEGDQSVAPAWRYR